MSFNLRNRLSNNNSQRRDNIFSDSLLRKAKQGHMLYSWLLEDTELLPELLPEIENTPSPEMSPPVFIRTITPEMSPSHSPTPEIKEIEQAKPEIEQVKPAFVPKKPLPPSLVSSWTGFKLPKLPASSNNTFQLLEPPPNDTAPIFASPRIFSAPKDTVTQLPQLPQLPQVQKELGDLLGLGTIPVEKTPVPKPASESAEQKVVEQPKPVPPKPVPPKQSDYKDIPTNEIKTTIKNAKESLPELVEILKMITDGIDEITSRLMENPTDENIRLELSEMRDTYLDSEDGIKFAKEEIKMMENEIKDRILNTGKLEMEKTLLLSNLTESFVPTKVLQSTIKTTKTNLPEVIKAMEMSKEAMGFITIDMVTHPTNENKNNLAELQEMFRNSKASADKMTSSVEEMENILKQRIDITNMQDNKHLTLNTLKKLMLDANNTLKNFNAHKNVEKDSRINIRRELRIKPRDTELSQMLKTSNHTTKHLKKAIKDITAEIHLMYEEFNFRIDTIKNKEETIYKNFKLKRKNTIGYIHRNGTNQNKLSEVAQAKRDLSELNNSMNMSSLKVQKLLTMKKYIPG